MLNTLTSLFKSTPAQKSYPMHLAGRGKAPVAIAHMALDVVKAGGIWSPNELTKHLLGVHDQKAADYINLYLRNAWKRGDIARAEIHQRGDQGRPSAVRYAADWRAL